MIVRSCRFTFESAIIWGLVIVLLTALWIPSPRVQAAESDEWFEGFEYPMRTASEGPWPIEAYWDKLNSTEDPNIVFEGERAAVWTNTYWRYRVFTKPPLNLPRDWTGFTVLEFHANSVNATGQVNTILVLAPNASNAYYYEIPTNWTGPRKIVIPLAEFKRIGNPDWGQVTQMELLSRFREHEPENPNHTTIYLDAMRLYSKPLTATLPQGAVHYGIRGSEAVIPLQLNNHGEVPDIFTFIIPDSASGRVMPEVMTGTLEPGESMVVNLRIHVDEQMPIGEETPIRFEIHSAAEQDTFPQEVRIIAQNRLEAEAVTNDLVTHRGETVRFELNLTNHSASLDAPYDIQLPDAIAEGAELANGSGTVSPGGMVSAVLSFPVPEDAPLGSNEHVITVYSSADDAAFPVPIRYEVASFLSVQAKEPDDGYKLAVPGQPVSYQITLENTSSAATDQYEIRTPAGWNGTVSAEERSGTLSPGEQKTIALRLTHPEGGNIGDYGAVTVPIYSALDGIEHPVDALYILSETTSRWSESFEYESTAELRSRWSNLTLNTEPAYVKEGTGSGKWANTHSATTTMTRIMPKDWTKFDVLEFWAYSEKATNQNNYLIVDAEKEEYDGYDYFMYTHKIDWEGWKHFVIPLTQFTKVRQASWDHVTDVKFTSKQYASDTPTPETVLYFDDFKVYGVTFQVNPAAVSKEALPGMEIPFFVEVLNRAEQQDRFEVRIPEEWQEAVSVPVPSGTLEHEERKLLEIRVHVPEDAAVGSTMELPVSVYSENLGNAAETVLQLEITEWQPSGHDRPRSLYSTEDIERAKAKIAAVPEFELFWLEMKEQADEWLSIDVTVPSMGGGQSIDFVTPLGNRLEYNRDEPHRHYSPDEDRYYTGAGYDLGWRARRHTELSQALQSLAFAYALTGELNYAERAKMIVMGYANLYSNYALQGKGGRLFTQALDEGYNMVFMAAAYDLIADSGLFTPEEQFLVERNWLRPSALTLHAYDMGISNWQTWQNAGIAQIGFVLGDRDLMELAVSGEHGLLWQLEEGVLSDGFWWEGSFGYHMYALDAIIQMAEGAKHWGYDLYSHPKLRSMFDAPLQYAYPNLSLPANNDGSAFADSLLGGFADRYEVAYARYGDPEYGWLLAEKYHTHGKPRANREALFFGMEQIEPGISPEIASRNYDGMGHAILRAGSLPNQTFVLMDYGLAGGYHAHQDKLHIDVFGEQAMLAPDLGTVNYAHPYYQQWYRRSTSHNTVVVDTTSQWWEIDKGSGPEDVTGELSIFLDTPDFKMMRANAEEAYNGTVDKYERTVFADAEYLLDWFDVRMSSGGHEFDWILHGMGEFDSEIPLSDRAEPLGTRHGYELMHSTKSQAGVTEAWEGGWRQENGTKLRVVSLPFGEREVIRTEGPGPGIRPNEDTTILLLRQNGEQALFVTLLQPMADGEAPLPVWKSGEHSVSIQLADRTDHLYYNPDAGAGELTAGKISTEAGAAFDWATVSTAVYGEELAIHLQPSIGMQPSISLLITAPEAQTVTFNGQPIPWEAVGDQRFIQLTAGEGKAPVWPEDALAAASHIQPGIVKLYWTPVSDEEGLGGYRILQNGVAVTADVYQDVSGLMSAVIGHLEAGQPYRFEIVAEDPQGQWSRNNPSVEVDGISETAPVWGDAVLDLVAVGRRQAVVRWDAVSGQARQYEIYGYIDGVRTLLRTVNGRVTTAPVTQLPFGKTILFQVEAVGLEGSRSAGPVLMITLQ